MEKNKNVSGLLIEELIRAMVSHIANSTDQKIYVVNLTEEKLFERRPGSEDIPIKVSPAIFSELKSLKGLYNIIMNIMKLYGLSIDNISFERDTDDQIFSVKFHKGVNFEAVNRKEIYYLVANTPKYPVLPR